MRNIIFSAALALAAAGAPAIAQAQPAAAPQVRAGTQIYGADGRRIGPAYAVERSGVVLIIIDGKLVRVPPTTLVVVNGKVTTSLTRGALLTAR
jgi:hypothetical protein